MDSARLGPNLPARPGVLDLQQRRSNEYLARIANEEVAARSRAARMEDHYAALREQGGEAIDSYHAQIEKDALRTAARERRALLAQLQRRESSRQISASHEDGISSEHVPRHAGGIDDSILTALMRAGLPPAAAGSALAGLLASGSRISNAPPDVGTGVAQRAGGFRQAIDDLLSTASSAMAAPVLPTQAPIGSLGRDSTDGGSQINDDAALARRLAQEYAAEDVQPHTAARASTNVIAEPPGTIRAVNPRFRAGGEAQQQAGRAVDEARAAVQTGAAAPSTVLQSQTNDGATTAARAGQGSAGDHDHGGGARGGDADEDFRRDLELALALSASETRS